MLSTVQLGVEYNMAVGELDPVATWFLLTESQRRPALLLGTSSDRIGSPKGAQCYYLTLAKRLGPVPVAPYFSLNYSEWDSGFNLPFGAQVDLGRGVSLRPMYDGERTHLLALFARERASVTFIWAWLERAGIAVSAGF